MPELVSCLMVTRNRRELAQRAIDCFAAQSWPDRELVIVDDGDEDYTPMVWPYVAGGLRIHYHRIAQRDGVRLGALRNLSIDAARGEWCLQWDDDEWYHPDRISRQMAARIGAGVALKYTLIDVPTPTLGNLVFRADTGIATPGTILFRRDAARYQNLPRNEDGLFMREVRRSGLTVLGQEHAHLFVRCYHGSNTWEQAHFLRRLRRRPSDLCHWLAAKARGDITTHPAFQLTDDETATVEALRNYSNRRSAAA
jgi:glycosyltransferase involved in cell wall biosynthesis